MASREVPSPHIAAGETYRVLSGYAVRIALFTLHAVCIAVAVLAFIDPGVPTRGRELGVAMAVWSAGRLVSRRFTPVWVVADLAVVAIYLIQTPWLVADTAFTSAASPMLAVAGTAVIAYGLAYPVRQSLPAALVVAAAWAVGIWRVPGAVDPLAVFSFDFLAIEWMLVALCRFLVVRAAVLTDMILVSAGDDEVSRAVAIARHRLARQHCAVMHDTAASTLLMVGQGAATNGEVLTRQVDRDLATIAAFNSPSPMRPEHVDLLPRLRALASDVSTPVRLTGDGELMLDSDIVDALEGATREALANVERHSHATSATMAVSDRAVTVADNGIGFDPASDSVARRFGVRNSIQGRLADIGGHAIIDSRPGAGTTVLLRWDESSSADQIDLGKGLELTQRLQRGFGYGLVAIATVVILLQSQRAVFGETSHRVDQGLIVLVALAGAAVAGHSVAHQVPTGFISATCAVVIAVVPLQEWLLPPASLTTGSNWALATLGWVIVALTYRRPIVQGLAALTALWVVGSICLFALRFEREVVVTEGYNAVSVALIQALALVFAGFLVTAVRTATSANEQHVRRWAAEAEERAVAEDVAARYSELSRTLVPVLRRLREPSVDPSDPQLRLTALIEGARLRRLFTQTDNHDHPLLQELQPIIGKAEDRGVTVTVDAGTALPDVPAPLRDQLLVVASMALVGAQSRARVVFTAGRDVVTVSVVCDCTSPTRYDIEQALGIVPAVAGDLTWVEFDLPLTADTRSPVE